jgi:histidine triad (HIT) family protein
MSFVIPNETDCPFCGYLSGAQPCAFVTRSPLVSSFLNRAQFERGATLVIPNEHVGSVLEVRPHVLRAIHEESQRLARGMVQAFGAVGLNIFQNNGVKAGQTVSHYHVHVVPRYETSEAERVFRAGECPRTPVAELLQVANELRAALSSAT